MPPAWRSVRTMWIARIAGPSTGTPNSSFFARNLTDTGSRLIMTGISMLDMWFPLKTYDAVGSSLSRPCAVTWVPVTTRKARAQNRMIGVTHRVFGRILTRTMMKLPRMMVRTATTVRENTVRKGARTRLIIPVGYRAAAPGASCPISSTTSSTM